MSRMVTTFWLRKHFRLLLVASALLGGLYLSSLYSYLLMHSLAEGFSVVVGFSIFLFAWNSRRFFKTDYFLFLGTAYLAAASLDFVHTLAYSGMGIFVNHDTDLPTQLWLAARFTQSAALLVSPIFLRRSLNQNVAIVGFTAIVGLWAALIFGGVLPTTYVEGEGLTVFKRATEYAIVAILIGAVGTHFRVRPIFSPDIFAQIITSIALTIVSELLFTLYLSVYDGFNLLGHFLKIVAFFLIYKAVLQTGLMRPFDLLFEDLEEAQRRYRQYFRNTLNPLAIFQVERDGDVVDYLFVDGNHALTRLLKIDPKDNVGKLVTELSPALNGAALQELLKKVHQTGLPQRADHTSPDGQRCFHIAVFLANSNQVAMFLEDITERKRTETILLESEARLRTVLENMPVLLFAIDEAGHIIAWNRECARVSGYSEAEVVANPAALEMLIPDDDHRNRFVVRARAGRETYRDLEVMLTCRDGSPRRIAWSSVADQFPVPGWADWVVGVDITERQMIEVLEREQRQLAEALRDVANTLNSALGLSELLDRVLVNVEHVIPHDIAKIYLIDPETNDAHVVGSHSADPEIQAELAELALPVATTPYLQEMVLTRQPLIVDDIQMKTAMRVSHEINWRAYLGAPIILEGQVIGFIGLGSWEPDFFTATHAARLEAFTGQVAIAIQNARLLERERALIASQERERLARDLHDAVSQTLFSASMIAEALPRQWQRNPEKALTQLAELHQLTRGAQAEMRVLLLELRPTSLLEVDLPSLLRQLAEAIRSRKRMAISLEIDGNFELEPDTKLALYRITQEALNNIAKHAHASKASIRLSDGAQGVELEIEDNGKGFEMSQVQPTSLGLDIMRERAEEIGAELTIMSAHGGGTHLRLFLPRTAAARRTPARFAGNGLGNEGHREATKSS